MQKRYRFRIGIIFSFFLLTWQNLAWAHVSIVPTFNCSKAKTPIEKSICTKHSALSYYDPILNTIFQVLKTTLPAEQFQLLKKQQLQWLKQLKQLDGADTRYAKRISELSIQYKDYLQPYYLKALADGKMSSNLLYAFMWFFYSDYDMSQAYSSDLALAKENLTDSMACGTQGCGTLGMLDVNSAFSILKFSPDLFIIAGQFNDMGEVTNSDGGVFSFYLAEPGKNKITLLKIQDTDNSGNPTYDSTLQVSRVASFDPLKKQIVLASVGGNTLHYSINLEKMRLDLM